MVTDSEAKAIIAENIKRILKEQGHSMYWLSQQTGDGDSKISKICRAETLPSAGFLMRAADALDVELTELTSEHVAI